MVHQSLRANQVWVPKRLMEGQSGRKQVWIPKKPSIGAMGHREALGTPKRKRRMMSTPFCGMHLYKGKEWLEKPHNERQSCNGGQRGNQ